jgi:hypothetical protein
MRMAARELVHLFNADTRFGPRSVGRLSMELREPGTAQIALATAAHTNRGAAVPFAVFLSLLLAFSGVRAMGQCAGKVSSPAAVADCAARETSREGAAILDPVHPYTLAELIDVAEHWQKPSTIPSWMVWLLSATRD